MRGSGHVSEGYVACGARANLIAQDCVHYFQQHAPLGSYCYGISRYQNYSRSGERYGSKTLSKRMKVSADKEVILQSVDSQPIKESTRTGGQGVDVQLTFTQEVTSDDEPLPQGKVYRKVVTFTGSPKV